MTDPVPTPFDPTDSELWTEYLEDQYRKENAGADKCFCNGKGWVMLVGMGGPNRRIPCPDCSGK